MLWSLLACLACARPPDAALFSRAITPGLDAGQAVSACGRVQDAAVRDECLATVVRVDDLDGDVCQGITDERWRGECWFTVAERLGREGDRWGANAACGHSGPFYDECLYHRWTAELSAIAKAAPDAAGGVPEAREIIAFWSNLQTIAGDPEEQLWNDYWFFAHNEHRPADLAVCQGLSADVRCEEGTRVFVLRVLLGQLLAPGQSADLNDRICRSGQMPALWLSGLYVSHPDLDAQVQRAEELACDVAEGKPVHRWNPVFRGRRVGGGDEMPDPGQPPVRAGAGGQDQGAGLMDAQLPDL